MEMRTVKYLPYKSSINVQQNWQRSKCVLTKTLLASSHVHFDLKSLTQLRAKSWLQTVDHLAHRSMKNAASCVNRCKLQNLPNHRHSNAHCAFNITVESVPVWVSLDVLLTIFSMHFDWLVLVRQSSCSWYVRCLRYLKQLWCTQHLNTLSNRPQIR